MGTTPAAEPHSSPAQPAATLAAEEGPEQQPVEVTAVTAAAAAAEEGEEQADAQAAAPVATQAAQDKEKDKGAEAEEQGAEQLQQQQQEAAQGVEQELKQDHHQHLPAQHAQHPHRHAPAAAAGSHSPGKTCAGYGTFPARAANGKALTFSGPPYVPVAKPYKRVDYSHSTVQLMKIAHDNQLLVNQLTTISKAVPSWTKDVNAPPAPGNTASSAVNRRKAATVIAQANHALYQRLVAIRPSKDISRETLEAGHRMNETYRANCAQFKPTSPTHKATAAPAQ